MNNLIDSLQTGILYEDTSGKIIAINQYFCNLLRINLKPSDLTGKDSSLIIKTVNNSLVASSGDFISRFKNKNSGGNLDKDSGIFLIGEKIITFLYIPVLSGNELTGHLWQVNDVTKDRQREEYYVIQKELGFSLSTVTTLDAALSMVLNTIIGIKGIDSAGIYLKNSETGIMELKISSGISEQFRVRAHKFGPDDPEYKYFMEGNSFFGPCVNSIPGHQYLIQENYFSTGVIPIKNEKDVTGSINILSKSDFINKDIIIMFESIASHIGRVLGRITAQNELIQTQKNFKLLFESIDEFVVIIDSQGKIILTNPALQECLGYTLDELKELPLLKLYNPGRLKEAGIMVDKIISGLTNKVNLPFCTKSGQEVQVETNIVPGIWDNKDAFYTISRDLTARIKAEEELRRSEARWQFALENSDVGLWDWDLTTNRIHFSDQWKKMFGYTKSDLPGSDDGWIIIVHKDDLSQMLSNLESHIKGDCPTYKSVHRIKCKNGSCKWVIDRGKVTSCNNSGIPLRIIGTSADISKMKDYDDLLTNALCKEKELNELKSRFVSKTSHEFRTPLSTMLVAVDTLEAYYDKMTKKQREAKIKTIKGNVQFLAGVIEKVMDLSHFESGKMKFEPVKVDICEFLDKIIEENRSLPQLLNKIEFKKPVNPVIIRIDEQMIKEVVNNLISNAIKYSPDLTPVFIKLVTKKKYVLISISDRGIGIPEKDKQKIFEPFHRGANIGNIRGTGLGLPLSKEFVRVHGGDITFTSRAEGGTTFFITLPIISECQ